MKLLAASLLSGVLFYLSIGAGTLWPLAWIAPLPLLVLALQPRTGAGVVRLAAGAALAFGAGMANMVVLYLGTLPIAVLAPTVLLLALAYGAAVAWFAVCARRGPLLAALAFAAAWTAWEWLVSLVSPHGTAGSIAYSQGDVPAVLQLAAVVGQYGITFALCVVPAALAGIAHRYRRTGDAPAAAGPPRRALVAGRLAVPPELAIVAGLAALVVALRLLDGPHQVGSLRAGLVVHDGSVDAAFAETPAEALAPLAVYEPAIAKAARDGATIVVLPERAFTRRAGWAAELAGRLQAIASANRVDLVVGVGDFAGEPRRNLAVVYRAAGGPAVEYAKHHLIPEAERAFEPGTGWLRLDGDRLGVAICKDLDFQGVARAYRGTRAVLAPAWDFGVDGELHRRMAAMRAVEGGFALVRTARTGYLSVHDAWGRLIGERASAGSAAQVLVVDVPLAERRPWALATPFGLAMLALALGCAVVRRLRR